MKKRIPMVTAVVTALMSSAALAHELPKLKVVMVEIVTNSAKDLDDAFRGLICILLILIGFAGTGCRTFNYTEADMERERRQISGSETARCANGCWHEGHQYGSGYGYGFGSITRRQPSVILPAEAYGKPVIEPAPRP